MPENSKSEPATQSLALSAPEALPVKAHAAPGRASEYSDAKAEEVCEYIATGKKGLVSYCLRKGSPGYRTVMRWLSERPDFQRAYVAAKEAQADRLAEEIVELADKARMGKRTTRKGKGKDAEVETVTGDMVDRSRLQIDARKWYAAKLAPKKYGDKLTQEVTGDLGVKVVGAIELAARPQISREEWLKLHGMGS